MRRSIILGSSAAAVVAVAFLWSTFGASSADNPRGAMCIGGHCCCVLGASAQTVAANSSDGRLTLDPNQFIGPAKAAYQVAQKNPGLLAQLHCYCGCDRIYGHQNLLDCYRGDHGSKCEICIGEAMMAEQMSEQGSPVDQIRGAIRRQYAGEN
jgi:hypothetical protein